MPEKRKIISYLNRLDLESADYNLIKTKIKKLIINTTFNFNKIEKGQKLYRARICSTMPNTISDLASPSDQFITNYQRCNPPNRAIFYCSSCRKSAMREINVNVGDTVYISEWEVKESFYAASIVPYEIINLGNESLPISVFFETKFLQPVHEIFSSQYKVTSAIFEELTNKILPPVNPKRLGDPLIKKGIHSLIYPSTANMNKSDCVAIDPKFAQSHLAINNVEERKIKDISKDSIEYKFKRRSYVFLDGSKILWPKNGEVQCGSQENVTDFYESTTFID